MPHEDVDQVKAPKLSALQLVWLQEIGLDKRMLARFEHYSAPLPEPSPETAATLVHAGAADSRPPPTLKTYNDVPPAPVVAPSKGLVRVSGMLAPPTLHAGTPGAAKAAIGLEPMMPNDLTALQSHIAACQACELHAGRSQTVFGTGSTHHVEWLLVGEAPGESDDKVGLPFQGRPGVLLQSMLASIAVVPESEVFFTNLIKCRPLGNRTPKPEEIAACLPKLQRQIALLRPMRILALGKLAAQALLSTDAELEQLRGRVHHIRSETGQEIPLVATYHPATLLLRPQHKADAWQDLNLLRSIRH